MYPASAAAHREPPHNLSTAYILALGGFMGFAGIHRFYLGKPFTGLIWFLTWGLFGIGTIYDLITMSEQVDWANRKALPPPYRPLPAARPVYQPAAPIPYLRNPAIDLEQRMLHLARVRGGQLTIPTAAAELGCTIEEAEAKLTHLAAHDHCTTEITEDGALVFDFPSLRAA